MVVLNMIQTKIVSIEFCWKHNTGFSKKEMTHYDQEDKIFKSLFESKSQILASICKKTQMNEVN